MTDTEHNTAFSSNEEEQKYFILLL